MLPQTLEASARAVIVRGRGEWVALTPSRDGSVVLGRSLLAGPLVKALMERGYSVRFVFSCHRFEMTEASNEPTPVRGIARAVGVLRRKRGG